VGKENWEGGERLFGLRLKMGNDSTQKAINILSLIIGLIAIFLMFFAFKEPQTGVMLFLGYWFLLSFIL